MNLFTSNSLWIVGISALILSNWSFNSEELSPTGVIVPANWLKGLFKLRLGSKVKVAFLILEKNFLSASNADFPKVVRDCSILATSLLL